MVLGDYYARHPMWQDTEINNHGILLEIFLATTQSLSIVSPEVPTFLSVNGNYVIDLVLLSSKMKAKLKRDYIEDRMKPELPGETHTSIERSRPTQT